MNERIKELAEQNGFIHEHMSIGERNDADASDISQERVDETAKQRHEWVGLTTEEVKTIVDSATSDNDGYDIFTDGTQVAFLVEAKLKEKNT